MWITIKDLTLHKISVQLSNEHSASGILVNDATPEPYYNHYTTFIFLIVAPTVIVSATDSSIVVDSSSGTATTQINVDVNDADKSRKVGWWAGMAVSSWIFTRHVYRKAYPCFKLIYEFQPLDQYFYAI